MRADSQRRGWAEALEKTQLHRRSKTAALRLCNIVFPILLGSGYLAGMNADFVKVIQDHPNGVRISGIYRAHMGYLTLRLLITLHKHPKSQLPDHLTILCTNAVEYLIRPTNRNTIEGGPLIEYYEDHKLLHDPGLQMIPGGDGEFFNPPLKLALLMLDQSYVIAEKFEIEGNPP